MISFSLYLGHSIRGSHTVGYRMGEGIEGIVEERGDGRSDNERGEGRWER